MNILIKLGGIEVLNLFKSHLKKVEILQHKITDYANKTIDILQNRISILFYILIYFLLFAITADILEIPQSRKHQSSSNSTIISTNKQETILEIYSLNKQNLSYSESRQLAIFVLDKFSNENIQFISNNFIADERIKLILNDFIKKQVNKENLFWSIFISIPIILIIALFYLKKLVRFYENTSFIILSSKSERVYNEGSGLELLVPR
ncbi:hypothetical protein QUF74_13685 [Candidatus Halobeggiatoa sp. HSG11]|nr:hypothetical protein [Candidatus Halobeggiatoa sp. HSG11]